MPLPARLKEDHFKPKERLRSTAHRDWVRSHYCSVPGCQLMPIEVAHVNRASTRGIGTKSSDAQTVSLCRDHHAESHRGERSFERKYGIDLMRLAREFYQRSPYRLKLDDPWGAL
jgi:hypothetical protein